MNNLFVFAIAASLGLVLFSRSQWQITEVNGSSADTEEQANAAAANARRTRADLLRLDKQFTSEQVSIQKLRAAANAAITAQTDEIDPKQLNPQKEGFWPAEKPYFYISKARLAGLNYWPFTDSDDQLSKTAALLFGMTPQEEAAANAAYATMREQIRQIEIAHAIPTNAPAWIESWPGNKKSFFIEAIPREIIDAMNQEFKNSLQEATGPERAALLSRRIDESFENSAFGLTKGRTFTLIREGDRIQLAESEGNGNTTASRSTAADGREEIPRFIRHIFRDE
jgi:hypothetical protein